MKNNSITYDFKNREDSLTVRYTKVAENGENAGIKIVLRNKEYSPKPIKVDKLDLLNNGRKLEKALMRLDIDFNKDEMSTMVEKAKEALSTLKTENDTEEISIEDVIYSFYREATKNVGNRKHIHFIKDTCLCINYKALKEPLQKYGWKPVEFKKLLKGWGVLNTTLNRSYDYGYNNNHYLSIRLNSSNYNFMEYIDRMNMEENGEVA